MVRHHGTRDAWRTRARCGHLKVVMWTVLIVPLTVGIPMLMASVALEASGGEFAHQPEVLGALCCYSGEGTCQSRGREASCWSRCRVGCLLEQKQGSWYAGAEAGYTGV